MSADVLSERPVDRDVVADGIDQFAGDVPATISFGLPFESEDSQYGESRLTPQRHRPPLYRRSNPSNFRQQKAPPNKA